MPFAPASRKHTFALIGLTGHSGTGKTYGALLLARGLAGPNGKIALIDTENGRGSMYSDEFRYDVQELHPPFTPARYTAMVEEAEKAGYGVLVIDSFSHEWESLGGVLEMADDARDRKGQPLKGLQKWMQPKIQHKRMMNAILQSRMHVIICMRGKDKFVQKKDDSGREVIEFGGVIPIQEKRVVYEMTVSLILDEQCHARHGKNPPAALAGLFGGRRILESDGAAIRAWLDGGKPVDHAAQQIVANAREQASYGTESFREHWRRISKAERDLLAPHVDELKSAATAADEAMGEDEPGVSTGDQESGVGEEKSQIPDPKSQETPKSSVPNHEPRTTTPDADPAPFEPVYVEELRKKLAACKTTADVEKVDEAYLTGCDRKIVGPILSAAYEAVKKPKRNKGQLPMDAEPSGTEAYAR